MKRNGVPVLAICLVLAVSAAYAGIQPTISEQRAAASVAAIAESPDDEPEVKVTKALKRVDFDAKAQAEVLARLAWPTLEIEPEVSAVARGRLVEYGGDGMLAIRNSIRRAPKEMSGDVMKALVQAFEYVPEGIPLNYREAMIDALWDGNAEARSIAMVTLARHRESAGLILMIDTAHEYPALKRLVIECLGRIGNERARHFLDEQLRQGDPDIAFAAAIALAQIGGPAFENLGNAMKDPRAEVRQVAALALSSVAGPEELTLLHEYVTEYPDDNPSVLKKARERAMYIEELLDTYQNLGMEDGG